jgi:hypothetical protein
MILQILYLLLIAIWLIYGVYLLIQGIKISQERIQDACKAYLEFKESEKLLKELLK